MSEQHKKHTYRMITVGVFSTIAAFVIAVFITCGNLNQKLISSSASSTEHFTTIMQDYTHSFLMYEKLMELEIETAEDEDEIAAYLKDNDKSLSAIDGDDYDGIYMYYNGRYLYSWDTPYSVYEQSGYNAEERPWYLGAVEANGEICFSVPYRSYANDYMLATISRLQPDGKTVFAYDIKLGAIQKYANELELYSGSLTMMCDTEGNIIGSTNPIYEGGNYLLSAEGYDELIAEAKAELDAITDGDTEKAEKKIESLESLQKMCAKCSAAIAESTEYPDQIRDDASKRVLCFYHTDGEYVCITLIPISKVMPTVLLIWVALALVFALLLRLYENILQRRRHTKELDDKNLELAEASDVPMPRMLQSPSFWRR